jgi:hypothetical protein
MQLELGYSLVWRYLKLYAQADSWRPTASRAGLWKAKELVAFGSVQNERGDSQYTLTPPANARQPSMKGPSWEGNRKSLGALKGHAFCWSRQNSLSTHRMIQCAEKVLASFED